MEYKTFMVCLDPEEFGCYCRIPEAIVDECGVVSFPVKLLEGD